VTNYSEANEAATTRLRALVERLSDDDLCREVHDGWTVAALLAHLALLDQLRLEGWVKQEQSSEKLAFFASTDELDVINAASQPMLLAIPPREAARQAIDAAESIDREIASLNPRLVESYLSTGSEYDRRMLDRSIHRNMHLDEIESSC
jgi:uncharacterized damage-inducible protein DinB